MGSGILFLGTVLQLLGLQAFAQGPANCREKPELQEFDAPISALHPTQPNAGMGEVLKKAAGLNNIDPKAGQTDDGEAVPVVIGPGGELFVTDHHHLVLSVLLATKSPSALIHVKVVAGNNGVENGACLKCPQATPMCTQEFWKDLTRRHLAYLCNEQDQPIAYNAVPASFGTAEAPALKNDPYRTLIYALRKIPPSTNPKPCLKRPATGVYFWEFGWAERIRRHLPQGKAGRAPFDELQGPQASVFPISQNIVDAACAVTALSPPEEAAQSCGQKISENPELITGAKSPKDVVEVPNKPDPALNAK